MSITVLGIDPSLTNTGLCWGSGPGHISDTIKYKIPTGVKIRELNPRMDRVDEITDIVEAIAEGVRDDFDPDSDPSDYISLSLIESYSFGSRNGGEYLGELGGSIRSVLRRHCVNVLEVAPTTVKKFATGKGNAKKEVIIGHVQKRWNVLFDNSDEADAYVLYRIGLCYAGICEPETQAQAEVIKKLKGE